MKKYLSLLLALVLTLFLAGCNLFSDTSLVKFDDSHTHKDPKGLTYDKRIVLKSDKFAETLEQFVNSAAYPDTMLYDEAGNPIGMYDYNEETGLAAGWTKLDDGTYTAFPEGKEVSLGKPDASKMIDIPGTVTLAMVVYGNKEATVANYIYAYLSDASAKDFVISHTKTAFNLTLTAENDTTLTCVQDETAIAADFKSMEESGGPLESKTADIYADILMQTYGVRTYSGVNPYKPYAGHTDPADLDYDQKVIMTGSGEAAVVEEYAEDISSMTDIVYGKDGNVVGHYSYYECPSKESADKLMAADAFQNPTRISDTVIQSTRVGKDMEDLLSAYMGYNVIRNKSVDEYVRMLEETFFTAVCE